LFLPVLKLLLTSNGQLAAFLNKSIFAGDASAKDKRKNQSAKDIYFHTSKVTCFKRQGIAKQLRNWAR
jgi:hypothetical protein